MKTYIFLCQNKILMIYICENVVEYKLFSYSSESMFKQISANNFEIEFSKAQKTGF